MIHILSATPGGGPCRIETADSLAGRVPAHSEPLDGLDAEAVASAARVILAPATMGNGWFAVSLPTARRAVEQASITVAIEFRF